MNNLNNSNLVNDNPKLLNGGRFDLSDTPDLLPALAILILKSSKPIEIFNVKHARYKETDRIAVICRELEKIGINVKENDDGMILTPAKNLNPAELNAENDHRLFMAFSIIGMYIGDCSVTDPDSVKVSYPDFIKDMKNSGAQIIPV